MRNGPSTGMSHLVLLHLAENTGIDVGRQVNDVGLSASVGTARSIDAATINVPRMPTERDTAFRCTTVVAVWWHLY